MSFLKYKYFEIQVDDEVDDGKIIEFIKDHDEVMVFGPWGCVSYDMDASLKELKRSLYKRVKLIVIKGRVSCELIESLKRNKKNNSILLQEITEDEEYEERHPSGEWIVSKVSYHAGFKILI